MKAHTSKFKENISLLGRELDSKITYTIDEEEIELGKEDLNSITPSYEGNILKSVMKQLDIDSNVEIPVGTNLNYQFGVLVDGSYEYLNYGNYIVKEVEKQEDTRSWKITCYDKLLLSMKNYEKLNIEYPITIRDYINAICEYLGITFANIEDTFANYDKEITSELYLGYDENTQDYTINLGYTFRDVLDELAEVTASTICINDEDELEIRYLRNTQGKNLFDKDNANLINCYCNNNGIVSNDNARGIYIQCSPNTTYTIQKNGSARFRICTTATEPASGVGKIDLINNDNAESITITTSNDANYLFIYFYLTSDTNEKTEEEVLDTMQIELGDTATEYEPYGDDVINEEYLKDVNVNFGEISKPINTITLSRTAKSDTIYLSNPTNLPEEERIAINIEDNQIMNGNNRSEYLPDILNQLYGLTYYINDFTSTGICYYDLCDRYRVKIGNNYYSCIMVNDEIDITQGLEEQIHTETLEDLDTDYKKADTTDIRLNTAYAMVDKANGRIDFVVKETIDTDNPDSLQSKLTQTTQTIESIQNIFQITGGSNLIKNSQFLYDDPILDDTTTPKQRMYWIFTNNGNNPYNNLGSGYNTSLIGTTTSISNIKIRDTIIETTKPISQTVRGNIIGLKRGQTYTLNYAYNQDDLTETRIQLLTEDGEAVKYFVKDEETGVISEYDLDITYNEEEINFKKEVFQFVAQASNYILKITTQTTTGDLSSGYFYLYDLMLNSGDKKNWEPAVSEVYSTVLKMSQLGLTVYATGSNTITLMNSMGFKVYKSNDGQIGEVVTEFTDEGLITNKAKTSSTYTGRYVLTELTINTTEHHVEYFEESDN